jgi:hypothetical protein
MSGISTDLNALLCTPMEPNLSVRALNALADAGLYTIEQVKAADLSRVRNMGPTLADFVRGRVAPSWRCFFCDDVFTRRQDAADHFGANDPGDMPACQIKAHEGHLVHALRKAHMEIDRYHQEDSDVMRSLLALESGHAAALQRAEETGYGRGVRDMQALAVKEFGREVTL